MKVVEKYMGNIGNSLRRARRGELLIHSTGHHSSLLILESKPFRSRANEARGLVLYTGLNTEGGGCKRRIKSHSRFLQCCNEITTAHKFVTFSI